MGALQIVVMILCLVPFLTGALDLLLGPHILVSSGALLPAGALADPVLNSQVRFWGAIWFSTGIMLFVAALDLRRHALWFRLLCGAIFLSGIGRLIALIDVRLPPPPLLAWNCS